MLARKTPAVKKIFGREGSAVQGVFARGGSAMQRTLAREGFAGKWIFERSWRAQTAKLWISMLMSQTPTSHTGSSHRFLRS